MTHSRSRSRVQRRCQSRRSGNVMGRTWPISLLLVVALMSDMTNGGVQGPIEGYNSLDDMTTTYAPTAAFTHPKWLEPYFDPSTPRNVTALMGKSAYLSCRVRNLGNKTVSWIRHRDIHILTVGSYTYTSDQRFQATHHLDTDDWTLQIKWAQKRDAGMYECQISTQPVRSYFVRLNVVVPTATILGGPDLHVDKGSTINLTCTVKFSPEPPAYIFWYHHDEVINYDSSRGGVSVITEKGDVTTSFLLIQNADLADSGKYSCAPSNADVASVRVHVLNGEHPEAMQTGSSGCQYSWLTIVMLVGLVLCYSNQQQRPQQQGHVTLNATLTTTQAKRTTMNSSSSKGQRRNSISIRQRQQRRRSSSQTASDSDSNSNSSTQSSGSGSIMSSKSSNKYNNNFTTNATTTTTTTTSNNKKNENSIANNTAEWLSSVEVNSCRCQLLNEPAAHNKRVGDIATASAGVSAAVGITGAFAFAVADPCTRPARQSNGGCNR